MSRVTLTQERVVRVPLVNSIAEIQPCPCLRGGPRREHRGLLPLAMRGGLWRFWMRGDSVNVGSG